MADLNTLKDAVIDGDQQTAVALTQAALDAKVEAGKILNEGLIAAMETIGDRFTRNEIYIPEMMIAARAMKAAMEILSPVLIKSGVKPIGKFVIGTVSGDQHDIGKNLVAIMMKGAGFEVIDLGVDVSIEQFIEKAKQSNASIIGLSTLLTTTMPVMEEMVKEAKKAGIKSKIMIGGAPVTQDFADRIGADGFAQDAAAAVNVAKGLVA
jgi:5-methyltetrahydrofolate--homocysteine methyltransferase